MSVEVKLTMFISKENRFYIYPFGKYLPKLQAKLQNGTPLSILPYEELSRMLDTPMDIDINTIRNIASELVEGITEEKLQESENFAIILLPEYTSDNYEELILTWKEPIERDRSKTDIFTFNVPLHRQFPPTGESSLYVEIKVNNKYKLQETPKVFKFMR